MQNFVTTSLKVLDNQLWVLDQQALPQQSRWLPAQTSVQLAEYIAELKVRGAPIIGLSASLLLALLAEQGAKPAELMEQLKFLRATRPTAVNLMNNLDRMQRCLKMSDYIAALVKEAQNLIAEDRQLCQAIAKVGSQLIEPSSRILTHCNTGGLATAGTGTALGVIQAAWQQGKIQQVWVGETRPLLQGARLTAWELKQLGIPYRIVTDSMAGSLMAAEQVDAVWVGADRIAVNGDVANKIGTYSLAVLARYHNIPFYVAAPHTTLDSQTLTGEDIPIEQRASKEVLGASGSFGEVQWAPESSGVWNPAFDVTPATLISGWILDSGFVTPEQVKAGIFQSHESV